jgi:hypothetical protein
MTTDRFFGVSSGMNGPGDDHFAVTPSDSAPFAMAARCLYVGGAGVVMVMSKSGVVVPYTVAAGGYILMRCVQVMLTGTTATLIVGIV